MIKENQYKYNEEEQHKRGVQNEEKIEIKLWGKNKNNKKKIVEYD